ncbi:MAG: RNA-directed DNA polymerase [Bacteroidota bacterium]
MLGLLEASDIHLAYKKLKSYVYHENFSLHLRVQISNYETIDIGEKLNKLCDLLNRYSTGKKKDIQKFFLDIDVHLMPKAFHHQNVNQDPDDAFYFSNANKQNEYLVDSCTPFINCPVELHIICVLWVMKIGHFLDSELNSNCYSNRLVRNTDNLYEEKSIKLFKKYYLNYNLWRNEAIQKAQELHNLNLDVVILNLDLKNYYNSVDFDFGELTKSPFSQNWISFDWLNTILEEIHTAYISKLKGTGFSLPVNKRILPIGLISSSILSNYYLRYFDNIMRDQLKPEFYGRYVDDILIVKSNPAISMTSLKKADDFINSYLVNSTMWTNEIRIQKGKHKDYLIKVNNNALLFQLKKVKLYHFYANESNDLLEEFNKEIRKNSSEFRFQPESQEVFDSFENASYKISYSDTINKIRSIDGFDVDKFGASKHLVKLINTTRNAEKLSKNSFEELNERVKTYFSGKRSLELSSLWEKVFTFYVVNGAKKQLIEFAKEQIRNILLLKFDPKDKNSDRINDRIIASLFEHLGNCFSMGAALNLAFFNESIINNIKLSNYVNDVTQRLELLTSDIVLNNAKALIQSNLLRHNYIFYPLVNYCQQNEKFNFLDKSINVTETSFKLDPFKVKYSPRFIHYHELCLFYSYRKWLTKWKNNTSIEFNTNQCAFIYKQYCLINTLPENVTASNKDYYPIESLVGSQKKISIASKKKVESLKVGIVNALIDFNDSFNSLTGKPKLLFHRLDEINKVLNSCLERNNKCDLIIFPEISIPYQWLSILTAFTKRNQVGIICGVEHIVNTENEALNFVATILPFMHNGYTNAIVDLRLKKDYSPEEKEQIKGRFIKIPTSKIEEEKMRLYIWNNIHFSVFNCFELSDIAKRSMFRGKVDFLATVEHNQDVNYFSNITESVARDIHSYIIQVNNSIYGDSRITRPSETYKKDIVKIKGGMNILAIIDYIDIKRLRDFQKLDYNLQKTDKSFKPTPPNFKMSESRKKY